MPRATIPRMFPLPHLTRSSARRPLGVLLAAVLAGCNPTAEATPSVSPSETPRPGPTRSPGNTAGPIATPTDGAGSASDTCPPPPFVPGLPDEPTPDYDAIAEQVVAIRGLEPTTEIEPQVLDAEGIRELTTSSFREDNPADLVAANELMLKGLGLLELDESLAERYVELLGSQVAGLYDPHTKSLYVVSKTGEVGPTEKTSFAHEFDHALQDQHFDLSSFEMDQVGEGDRGAARLALVEGDATLLMTLWQVERLTQEEFVALLGEAVDPETTRILNETPPVLLQGLLFPYTSGVNFVQCLYADGGWAGVDAAYDRLPASTEQILHPSKYAAGEEPLDVELPDDLAQELGDGWKATLEDTLGEFQLKVWLEFAGGGGGGPVEEAAAGWGGDRSVVLDGPGDDFAIVIATEWDSAEDAAQFIERAEMALTGVPFPGIVDGPAGGTTATVVVASTDALVGEVETALGVAP